ncbi:MAG: WD40/YVTN/BNR-like repeat-containing protein [Longimicrobiales bacterium]
MNTELLTRVQQVNPATSDDSIPIGVWGAQQVLEELKRQTDTPVPWRPRPNRPWLIAAAVAVAVLIMIGGLGVLTRDRGTIAPPVINQPEPTPTTLPDTSLPVPAELDLGALSWKRVPDTEELFGAGSVVYSVVASDSIFVAVGTDAGNACQPVFCGATREGSAAVWTSVDGSTWTRVPHSESVFGGPGGQEMWDVTTWEGGFVAVGVDTQTPEPGITLHPPQIAAVWTSPDGVSWSRVQHDVSVFGGSGRQEMWSVAASESGIVAAGFDEEGPMNGSAENQAIWVSRDGAAWTQVPPGFGTGTMHELAATPTGFIGVGESEGAAVWTSADGVSWTLFSGSPVDAHDSYMTSIAVTNSAYVATGADSDRRAAVWTSADRETWTRIAGDPNLFASNVEKGLDIAGSQAGIVAVGNNSPHRREQRSESAIWISPNPGTWNRRFEDDALFAEALIQAVAMSDAAVVVAGSDGERGAIWVGVTTEGN